jgi:hypothetical protein
MHLKEGTGATIVNCIYTNFYKHIVELTETETEDQAGSGGISVTYSLFYDNSLVDGGSTLYGTDEGSSFDLEGFIEDGDGNIFDEDPQLGSISFDSPDPVPAAGSPVLGAGTAPGGGLDATDYIGAFEDSNWAEGWTNFDPT